MTQYRHLLFAGALCATVLVGVAFGWFKVLDDAARDMRFIVGTQPASGEVILVEIDAQSVADVGSASRARGLYASVINTLIERGADIVVLDVALRGTLGYFDDNALANALTAARGAARTTAHLSAGRNAARPLDLPLERFAAVAPPVFVDSEPSEDGIFRSYRTRMVQDGWVIESLATALSPDTRVQASAFLIDFGIDIATIPKLTVSQVIRGDFDSNAVSGKKAVIGLSGYSTQNTVVVPRHGVLPVTMVQLLAAETVRKDRMLAELGPWPVVAIVLMLGGLFFWLRKKFTLAAAVAAAATSLIALEFAALGLHMHMGLLLDTPAAHVVLFGLMAMAVWQELGLRGRTANAAARERDSMRGILTRVIADNFDGVVVVDNARTIRAASRLAEELIGPGLVGKSMDIALPEPFRKVLTAALDTGAVVDRRAETVILGANGERHVEFVVTLSSVDAHEVSAESAGRVACLTFRDVTERRHVEERLKYLAEHDPLTGAASRVRFLELAESMLSTPAERAEGICVLMVGLSRLKTVNDTLGHAYGDELLRQVVTRLEMTGAVCVARLEGNSFGLVHRGRIDTVGSAFAQRVKAAVSKPYIVGGHHAIIGANIGITDTDLSGTVAETLVSHASMALSIAGDAPDNAVVSFAKEMDTRVKNKQDMEIALRAALENCEFTVHYQPQVNIETGEILGVEALTRWSHPELGNVSPADFIPAAEETGLIIALGRWILHTACAEVANWPKPVRLSVNVSPMQFEFGDIVADVFSALEQSGLPSERLAIEITEGLLVAETTSVSNKLKQLRERGVGVALDDFGMGYSSLSYLGRLPVDTIKIDQSFIRGMPEDSEATAIVRAVLMLSESLGKDVVAEGIETQDQAWLLRLAGCKVGQGYLFGRPSPAEVVRALIDEADSDVLPAMKII